MDVLALKVARCLELIAHTGSVRRHIAPHVDRLSQSGKPRGRMFATAANCCAVSPLARDACLDQAKAQGRQIRNGGLDLIASINRSDTGGRARINEIARLQAEQARQM